jgi:hypothetical protein
MPGWQVVVAGQAQRLKASGLLAATGKILVGISCLKPEERDVSVQFVDRLLDGKATFATDKSVCVYEFLTLKALQDYVGQNGDGAKVWYIHTKGIMSGNHGHRLAMEKATIDRHEFCQAVLDEMDTCGVFWRDAKTHGSDYGHYSGNFWWANSAYLKTLPKIADLDLKNRYLAEFWIGMGKEHKHFDMGAG